MSNWTTEQYEQYKRDINLRAIKSVDGNQQPLVVEPGIRAARIVVPVPKAAAPKPRMNKTETAFKAILDRRDYVSVAFEAITLELATGARYTPDFYCVRNDDLRSSDREIGADTDAVFYEVKGGFIREAALVRLKVAARQYPQFTFILAQLKKGVWTETTVRS